MSFFFLSSEARAIAEEQGWDGDTVASLLHGLIEEKMEDAEAEIVAHFQAQADEENEGLDEDDEDSEYDNEDDEDGDDD